MPINVVKTKEDERHWQKAKTLAEQQGHKDDWPYVMGIYQKIKGTQKLATYDCFKYIKHIIK